MDDILKQYDDMRIMRMVKKQLIECDKKLELLKTEYDEKDDALLAMGIKKEITNRVVDDEAIQTLMDRLEELEKDIKTVEEDKSNLASFNVYSRK
ncbi:hypothetical protein Q5O24_00055 [Eubacteriaceae bacterium ES3]|nr:hypothetical protein Q5O24_00055 [Eubacteriaceae bacterium ES3]